MSVRALPAPAGELEVTELHDAASFDELAEEWNALVDRSSGELFLRHEFLGLWLRSFARSAELRILLGRDADGRLAAALPLLVGRGRLHGVPVRELVAAANVHSCRFDLLADDPDRAAAAFLAHLARDPGWDLLRLIDLPGNGHAASVLDAARAASLPAGLWRSHGSPVLDLPASEEELDRRLSSQLRATVRRRRRRLAELGELTFGRRDRDESLEELRDCFELERNGWKGRDGTACFQDREALDFYLRLASLAARRGWLALYLLRLDGKPIAFQYGLVHGGVFNLLKLSFDERLAKWSPGLVLQDEVVRDCMARGLRRCAYLGGDEPWKRRWASGAVEHFWLFVFRDDLRGRLLRRAKFDWAPVVKRGLGRLRGHRTPGDVPA